MTEQVEKREESAGELKKRRVTMPDGKRYLIYYTFEKMTEETKENSQSAITHPQVLGGENV